MSNERILEKAERREKVEREAPIKVDPAKLEAMLELIGEMVVIKSQLAHSPIVSNGMNSDLQALVTHFDRTVRDLQEQTLSLRLTSLKPLFLRVQRAVRDIAIKLGKQIEFDVDGDDTEIDRGLIEAVTDPLMHLARNAVDHGLESNEERLAAGKSLPGRITLSARTVGDRVVIEMRDDGRGLNREKILQKARQVGLLAEGTGVELTDREIAAFLFESGFSTAEKVTDLSGRGVGLDVVRAQVEKVRGSIDVESFQGRGTCFRLMLPLTTAITDGLLVLMGGVKFVLPLGGVREITRVASHMITRLDTGVNVIGIRGRFLPFVDLKEVLRFNGTLAGVEAEVRNGTVIIADHAGGTLALLVDDVIGQTQVVVKPLTETVRNTDGLTGGAIMGDGSVALVMDLDGVAREHHRYLGHERFQNKMENKTQRQKEGA
jgi:two-component system chemotaxis sensor kinase CheA